MNTIKIETERLVIRNAETSDAESAFGWLGDPDVFEYEESLPMSSVDEARSLIRMNMPAGSMLVIEAKGDGLIGQLDVEKQKDGSVEVGYWLSKKHWGKGYATESLTALVGYLRAKSTAKIRTEVNMANAKSLRVLEKCGFKLAEQKKRPRFLRGDVADFGTFVYKG